MTFLFRLFLCLQLLQTTAAMPPIRTAAQQSETEEHSSSGSSAAAEEMVAAHHREPRKVAARWLISRLDAQQMSDSASRRRSPAYIATGHRLSNGHNAPLRS